MATYLELYQLAANPGADSAGVQERIGVAIMIAAQAYLAADLSSAAEKQWATRASASPSTLNAEARRLWPLVLAANKAASIAQINAATDATVQSAVDLLVAQIAAGSV